MTTTNNFNNYWFENIKLNYNTGKVLDWSEISKNKRITWDIIKDNPKLPWNWDFISSNPNITWDIIKSNPNLPWNWYYISFNPSITWDIIEENKNKPNTHFDLFGLRYNPNIPWNIMKNDNTYLSCHSSNPSITWKIIRGNLRLPWNWTGISTNPNITWDIIKDYPHMPWNWSVIGMNPNITWDIIKDNQHIDWNWYYIGKNPNITWDIIKSVIDNPASMRCLVRKFRINDPDFLRNLRYENPCFPFHAMSLSVNPNISWEIIRDNPQIPWSWYNVCKNDMEKVLEKNIRNEKRKIIRETTQNKIQDFNVIENIIIEFV